MDGSVSGSQPAQPSQEEQKKTQAASQEEVEEYIKIREEAQQIETILTIAQNMVQEQLQKAREQGKEAAASQVALNMESVPMTGDAQQQGNIATFNALQPQMAIQIQSLASQTAILKASDPDSAQTYDSYLSQLESIANSFPKLSQDQADTLDTIFTKLQAHAGQADTDTKAAFWQEVGGMYQNIFLNNEQATNEAQTRSDKLKEENAPESDVQGAKQAAGNLGSMQNTMERATAGAGVQGAAQSGSLPNQFQQAILSHYMPGQEVYLMELAEVLSFDNLGADIGNDLLKHMSGWNSAGNNYDFSSWLQDSGKTDKNGNTVYNGTADEANSRISTEKNQAKNDENKIKKSINKINNEINSIRHNKSLTSAQRNKIIGQLQGIRKQLNISYKQVDALYNLLSHIHAASDGSSHFILKGDKNAPPNWQSELPALEDIVVNGATKTESSQYGVPKGGGLVNVQEQTNSFQSNYSNMGQNQQMMLQMRMTEIQQEWTVVSTALQLLNQMYMTVAQGIYQ